MRRNCLYIVLASVGTVGTVARSANAIGPNVIYSEVAAAPSGSVPGALGAGAVPVATNWLAIEEVVVRPDGGQWIVKGRTTQATTNDSILMIGSGLSGTMFAQDGQPLQGGVAGEQYDFFDTPIPASWDSAGNIGFSCRAKGGLASTFEKVIKYNGVSHGIVLQMGDAALGLIDNPPGNSGNETFGNSINSVHLLDDGRVGFVNTPITNLSSTRYPAFFRGNTSFRQSGISPIGGNVWDSFDLDGAGGTPDGNHWYATGDDEGPTTTDRILAVDDAVVMRETFPVAGVGTPIMTDVFFMRMLTDGTWYARGDDPSDNDWAVRSGTLLAKTGDLISGLENWGNTFTAFTGNLLGQWILAGNTNNPDTTKDNVLAYMGTTVLLREGDPIDVDGNGVYDDNAFVNSFQPDDLHLTGDGLVYLLVTLRNGAGTGIGDAFLRLAVPEPTTLVLLAGGLLTVARRRRRR